LQVAPSFSQPTRRHAESVRRNFAVIHDDLYKLCRKNASIFRQDNHSPYFAPVPEPSTTTGVRAMTAAVLSALGAKS